MFGALLRGVSELPRRKRRLLLVSLDLTLLLGTVWMLLSIRYWTIYVPDQLVTVGLIVLGPLITVGVFLAFRVYHIVARYLGYYGGLRLGACVAIAAAVWSMVLLLMGQHGVPRSVVLAYVPAGTLVVVLVRMIAASLLSTIGVNVRRRWRGTQAFVPVLIYGVGPEAVRLGKDTSRSRTRKLIGYIEGGNVMAGRFIGRSKVYRQDRIQSLIEAYGIEEIYIADPRQPIAERRKLLSELEGYKVRVRVMPDMESLALGRVSLNMLRGVEGRDLLGREEVPPDPILIARAVAGKCVLVTGAGGSIGSRIALHALKLKPRRLVLLDHSELAIFEIEKDCLAAIADLSEKPELVKVLGSVADMPLVGEILERNEVDVVVHAAAYKHLPIVEEHPLAGISNNVLATQQFAQKCKEFGVERFVLISSDKAVRPKSVMGATKRVAELIIQGLGKEGSETIFTSVRFGNVLESSGSVFGLFRNQIRAGGPVTVTDPNVVRYFMSLEEATNLVLQAAGMAHGGEVFVLDMGDPVKIDDLARSMIRLMGYEERTDANPDGEIEINYIGLRPGEKPMEELVLSEHSISSTQHPRICKSHEPDLDALALKGELETLRLAVGLRSVPLALTCLERIVEGYCAPPFTETIVKKTEKIVLH